MDELEDAMRELGLENRIFILKLLKKGGLSISKIKSELKKINVSKTFSTVGRYMRSLSEVGLVCSVSDEYYLTLKGRLILNHLEVLRKILMGLDKSGDLLLQYPIDYLPDRFLDGLRLLGVAEVVNDPFKVMWDSVKAVSEAKKEVWVVNTDIINREFGELAVKRCVDGLKIRSVVYSQSVTDRMLMLEEIISEQEITGVDLKDLKRNFLPRAIDVSATNLIVADKQGAGISLPQANGNNSLTPAFKSDNKQFIDWVKSIFDFYWKMGREVSWLD